MHDMPIRTSVPHLSQRVQCMPVQEASRGGQAISDLHGYLTVMELKAGEHDF
jgi:hypothetical protein